MVIHGSDMGGMSQFGFPGEKVFKWSTKDLTSDIIDIGLGGHMPTLDEWLAAAAARHKTMFINFEVKGPLDPVSWLSVFDPVYDYDNTCLAVILLLDKYKVSSRAMISSFNPEIYESTIRVS